MSGLTERLSLIPQSMPGRPAAGPGPLRFSLDGVPERERPAAFRELFGREVARYDVELMPDVPFDIDVKLHAFPGLMMMWGRAYGSRNQRTPEMLAADPTDDIGMVVNLGGQHRVTYRQKETMLAEGEATIISLAEVWSSTHLPPGSILAIRVPRAQIAPLVADIEDRCFAVMPRETPALRLLTDYVRVVQEGRGAESPDLQHLVVAHIHDLMAVAIGATRDAEVAAEGRGLHAARFLAIKKDIAARLDQPDLSVATLAHRHGCTPRFIQRLFETEGTTFTDYVRNHRLARAHRLLSDPRRACDKISTIALDAGFNDVSYFNRAFRQFYGDTPSGVRAQASQLS